MIDLSGVTPRVQRLPRDERGYPIPRFVEWVDGRPDFRLTSGEHLMRCLRHRRCWVCGEPLGRHVAFVCGPTTAITLKTSEPGSHLECARAAVRICPYIMFPQRSRDEPPAGVAKPAGVMTLKRNPGVWMLYVATDFSPVQHGEAVMIKLGEPVSVEWFKRGKPVGLDEVADVLAASIMELSRVNGGRNLAHLLEPALALTRAARNRRAS